MRERIDFNGRYRAIFCIVITTCVNFSQLGILESKLHVGVSLWNRHKMRAFFSLKAILLGLDTEKNLTMAHGDK